jgi:antitoxin HicB
MKDTKFDPVKEVLNKPYARRLVPDETGGFVASILEFPGCIAEGDSPEEAMANLNAAAASWVEVALANGYAFRDPIEYDGYNGKVALRLPRSLHRQVAELAELEASSINQLLVMAISHYVSGKQLINNLPRSAQITNNVVIMAKVDNKHVLTAMGNTEIAFTDKSPLMRMDVSGIKPITH